MKRNSIKSIISGTLITVIISSQTFFALSAVVYAAPISPTPPSSTFNSNFKLDTSTPTSTYKPGTIKYTPGQSNSTGLQKSFENFSAAGATQDKINLTNATDPALTKTVPGCTGLTNKVLKSMAGTMTTDVQTLMDQYDDLKESWGIVKDLFGGGDVETTDEVTNKNTKKIASDSKVTKFREECLNGVAYALSKKQLANITQQTLNWISHGYDGDPLFVRDASSFFKSIADKELKNTISTYSNGQSARDYPYGRNFAKDLINTNKSQNNFEDSTKESLTNYLSDGATIQSYSKDFSQGGWNAWLSLTQQPQNNPLGFTMIASQQLANKTSEKIQNQKDENNQNNGFLSQKKCVEYSEPVNTGYTTIVPVCLKYETVTPGSVIASQLFTVLGSPIRQLELADGVNESLDKVFSKLLKQLGVQGLGSLGSFSSKQEYTTGDGTGFNKVYDAFGVDISGTEYAIGGNLLTVNKGSGWSAGDTPFDLTKDLGDTKAIVDGKLVVTKKGVISIQKDHSAAVKKSITSLPYIVPALGELDYCIPGPNPRWAPSTALAIDAFTSYLEAIYMDNNGMLVKPDPALFEKQFNGTRPWDNLNGTTISKFHASFGEGISNFEYKVDKFTKAVPIIGPILGTASRIITGIIKSIGCIFGGCDGPTKEQQRQEALEKAQAKFEEDRAYQIAKLQAEFNQGNPDGISYSSMIKNRYGANSPMLTESLPSGEPNPAYLPMAQAGLSLTQNIKIYELNVAVAEQDYQDLLALNNANIYKLNIIKKKVDVIIAAAQKRRAAERKALGLPAIPQICLNTETISYTDDSAIKYNLKPDPATIFPAESIIFPGSDPITYPKEPNAQQTLPDNEVIPPGVNDYLHALFDAQE